MSFRETQEERKKRLSLLQLKRVGRTSDGQMVHAQFLFFLVLADKYKYLEH